METILLEVWQWIKGFAILYVIVGGIIFALAVTFILKTWHSMSKCGW